MRVTVEDPNGKGTMRPIFETDAIIVGEDTLTLWLGGERVDALEAYRQGAGEPVAVYPMAWVKVIEFDPPEP